VSLNKSSADHSGRAVKGMNCLRSLKPWDCGFESHLRHRCLYVRLFCVGSGLATDWSLIQRVVPSVKKRLRNWRRGRAQQRAAELLLNEWNKCSRPLRSTALKRDTRISCVALEVPTRMRLSLRLIHRYRFILNTKILLDSVRHYTERCLCRALAVCVRGPSSLFVYF
jgi:hypothetical protein